MKKFHRLPWKSWISSVYVLQIVCHVTAMSKIFFHHIIKLRICKNNHALYFGDLRNVTSQLPNFIFNWRIQVLEELSCQRYPSGIYLFKFNIGNTKTRSEICSKLTDVRWKTSLTSLRFLYWEQISHIALLFSLLTLNK